VLFSSYCRKDEENKLVCQVPILFQSLVKQFCTLDLACESNVETIPAYAIIEFVVTACKHTGVKESLYFTFNLF
jgi:hypothetical protein